MQVDLLDWWDGEVLLEPFLLFDGGWGLVDAPVFLLLARALGIDGWMGRKVG